MDNIFYILFYYLKKEGYSLKKQDFKLRLFSDPNSMVVSITNTLDFFGIKNIVATVPKTSFKELPQRFIAQVNRNNQFNLIF